MAASDFRNETAAAYEARKELGPDYERAVLESFVDRAAESINERVDARLAELGVQGTAQEPVRRAGRQPREKPQDDNAHLAVPVFSVVSGAVATIWLGASGADASYALLMWVALAVINAVQARRRRSP